MKLTSDANGEVFNLGTWSADIKGSSLADTDQSEAVSLCREPQRINHHKRHLAA